MTRLLSALAVLLASAAPLAAQGFETAARALREGTAMIAGQGEQVVDLAGIAVVCAVLFVANVWRRTWRRSTAKQPSTPLMMPSTAAPIATVRMV